MILDSSCADTFAGLSGSVIARFLIPALAVCLSCCKEKREVILTETRAVTSRDTMPKLHATSDQRFRDTKPSPIRGSAPSDWHVLPPSQFRLLNYRFGESGMGEVWVSISAGSVLDNANRWLKQFNRPAVDAPALERMKSIPVADSTGVWIEADGDYAGGMGAPARTGFAMAGVIAKSGDRILTVKMVGPKAEVEAARGALETYITTLKWVE